MPPYNGRSRKKRIKRRMKNKIEKKIRPALQKETHPVHKLRAGTWTSLARKLTVSEIPCPRKVKRRFPIDKETIYLLFTEGVSRQKKYHRAIAAYQD